MAAIAQLERRVNNVSKVLGNRKVANTRVPFLPVLATRRGFLWKDTLNADSHERASWGFGARLQN